MVANLDKSLAEASQSKMFDYRDFTTSGVVVSSDDGSSDESDEIRNVKVVLDQFFTFSMSLQNGSFLLVHNWDAGYLELI